MARRMEETHELEGRIELVTAKSRLVEDAESGIRYWVPKTQTYDFNPCNDDGLFLLVVSDWWWRKKEDFVVQPREQP